MGLELPDNIELGKSGGGGDKKFVAFAIALVAGPVIVLVGIVSYLVAGYAS